MANQKLPTPLDYVHFLAGLDAPEEEPDVQMMPVPTPVYMPNPRTLDESQIPGLGGGGPFLPPPVATPPGMQGGGGMFAPAGGVFG